MSSPKRSYLLAVCLMLALLLALSGCADPNESVETVTMIVTAEDISLLDNYPNLKEADLRGSTCYAAIEAYIAAHPGVAVEYTVDLGRGAVSPDVTELELTPDSYKFDRLMANLKYLPKLERVDFPLTTLSADEIASIRESYSVLDVEYTVELLGAAHSPDEMYLNLSQMKPSEIDELLRVMPMLPDITQIELMDATGSSPLSKADVKALQDALPGVSFHYSFDLFGKTVSTTDEVIEYEDLPIGNEGEAEIREALDILSSCTYFKLDDCGLDSETMASIRDDYPDVKVVWRVHISYYNMLTDEEMLRVTHKLTNDLIGELQYCTAVKYADFGHNSNLTDFSFIAYMPNLEIVIASGSPVSDISAFANCPNLEWLELAFCGNVKDLSCLAGLQNLKYLNVSNTRVSDLSPLADLKLERFSCMKTKVSAAEERSFNEKHPDCLTRFEGKQPYGYGWRYDDYGYTFFEYYARMREIFRYDDKDFFGNHKEGTKKGQ